jgi:hypothetical protein
MRDRRTHSDRRAQPDTVLGVLSAAELDAAAAHLGEPLPPDSEHRTCCACGDPATRSCEVCGAAICADQESTCADAGEELLCWVCARPPRCREAGCVLPLETYSGRCRPHHREWCAAADAQAAKGQP